MPYANPDALVETAWLADNLGTVKVLDCSWYLPAQNRDPVAEYHAGHIPGAQFFHIDQIADPNTDLPHMLPSAADFGKAVGAMGISNTDRVVVYDGIGLQSAARVWWEFRAFGHDNVALLNGGLPKWTAEGRALDTAATSPTAATFSAWRFQRIPRSLCLEALTAQSEYGKRVAPNSQASRYCTTQT